VIVHDAATLFTTVIHRAVLAVEGVAAALAFVVCVVAYSVGPLVAPGLKAARTRLRDRQSAEPAPQAPEVTRRRPVPSWACTEPYNYDEAA
jgi:hypothetical protein